MSVSGQRVIPALRITNYERSKGYYVDQLGFDVAWEHRFAPGFPVFIAVARDGMQIYLTEHAGDCEVGGLVHLLIEDVTAWYEQFRAKGARVAEPPNNDLGFLNMTIVDPDGNRLRFMEPSKQDG
jgi:catechol 2,3-dioxygenase-like lactoylglutathione lyase family enzyme